ncbi:MULTISPECIES: hypothetical protein [Stenotrophomonas]|nr:MULTISPECIES: hypothetical protein [Stenotrophomonas]MDH7550187.1 hypothetical protein [Stenotrophomonas geniculata]
MRFLTAIGCRSWRDFAAFLACYAITAALAAAMCWPLAWSWS